MNIQFLISLFAVLVFNVSNHTPESKKTTDSNVIWKSSDEGKSWQNISKGLSEKSLVLSSLIEDKNLLISSGKSLYQHDVAKGWKEAVNVNKEIVDILPAGNKTYLVTYPNSLLEWKRTSMHTNVKYPEMVNQYIRSIYELPDGSILLGCQYGIYKTNDKGQRWIQVNKNENISKIVAIENALICSSSQGLMRSIDNGNHWELVYYTNKWVLSTNINGKEIFALTKSIEEQSNYLIPFKNNKIDVLYSKDFGKTWTNIELSVADDNDVSSICFVKNAWYCSIKNKVFQSNDFGKTWKMLTAFDENVNLKLETDGNVIFAMNSFVGC